jgi:hypothetical protein
LYNAITAIVDEITGELILPLSKYVNTFMFTSSDGINSDVIKSSDELNKVVDDNTGKVIFVASSLGAFTALTYAKRFPGKLLGLVLLDPTHPMQGESILNILNNNEVPESKDLDDLKEQCSRTNEAGETGSKEIEGIISLNSLNLLVLIAGEYSFSNKIPDYIQKQITDNRHKMLIDYTKLTDKGQYKIIPKVGHAIAHEAPEIAAKIINDYIHKITKLKIN